MKILNKFYNKFINGINDDYRNILLNVFGMLVCKGVSILFSLLLFPTYITFFDNNAVLGMWFTILAALNWILIFDLGVGNGLRNKLPIFIVKKDYDSAKIYISSTYAISFGLSIVMYIAFYFFKDIINWNTVLGVDECLISSDTLTKCVHIVTVGILLQFSLKNITYICYVLQRPVIINVMAVISNIIILFCLLILDISTIEEKLITISYVNVIAVNIPMVCYSIYLFRYKLNRSVPSFKHIDTLAGKELLQVGLTLLWLQIIFLVVSSTNEFFITWLTDASNVVEYQAYYRVYGLGSVVFSFALVPIWSTVTKAKIEKNYTIIKNIYKFFLKASIVCLFIEIFITFFVQDIFDLWLGDGKIDFQFLYGLIFAFHSTIFILHNINTSISNGLSYFRFQIIGMTIAALIDYPLAIVFVNITGGWIGVLLASSTAMLFYELLAPYFTMKYLDSISEAE